ncbi:MAG: hypothetical protein AVDCRST_MAG72-928 [uncultured Nocardioidaceae bacterium]|uniref:Uncharacterized protein n=1 Tax=uncultured Nocardioidaceae bacterium TaxID=253824 RepID=A0A6J4LZZ3_9ACTN|nr:MAG: hypothetical protein AVDCRST_MAG72-928 [uncultured Nocardioidaceae bacterium]
MSGRDPREGPDVESPGPRDRRSEFLRSRGQDDDQAFYRPSTADPPDDSPDDSPDGDTDGATASDAPLEQPREPENDEDGP